MTEEELVDMEAFLEGQRRVENTSVCAENPVMRRAWGGELGTDLMIELYAPAFEGGYVWVEIECGYLGLDHLTPQQFVKCNCSGLVYVSHHIEGDMCNIIMRTDAHAVKPGSPYPYLVSGNGAGEYQVAVNSITNIPEDRDMSKVICRNLYYEDFCCK